MAGTESARPLVMGVLNVTPDSFSDGGRFLERADALDHARSMIADGADLVDVGGESSRPGAEPVPLLEEIDRVLPMLEALSGEVRLSIDTVKPEVAARAAGAGATLINDVSGTLADVAVAHGVGWVSMHMQGTPQTMQRQPSYTDVVDEVFTEVLARARAAAARGVREVWVDPGIGFGKTTEHNLALLAHLGQLVLAAADDGFGVLVGTSRKRFLGVLGAPETSPRPVDERFEGSLATAVWAMTRGAGMVRVHDVADTVRAAQLVGDATITPTAA